MLYLKNMKIQQQVNPNEIQWNDKVIKPNNEGSKTNYIDIDNNDIEITTKEAVSNLKPFKNN